MSFDKLDTAQRMREVMRKFGREQAVIASPPPMIARMTQVDITTRTGEAWIVGDDDTVPVILNDGLYPGRWDSKDGASTDGSLRIGSGSMVVLQNYNGRLYVTDVLTGGRLLYHQNMMGFSITPQMSEGAESHYSGGRGHVGYPHEFFFNEHIEAFDQGADTAVIFGPFHGGFGFMYQPGKLEITVHARSFHTHLATKTYNVIIHPQNIFQDGGVRTYGETDERWFRLLPEAENTNGSFNNEEFIDGATPPNANEFDIDIAYRGSPYTNNDFDLWLRYTQLLDDLNGIDIWVTIRTTMFDTDQPINVKKQIVQINDPAPKPIVGYLGFHNSNHIFHDKENATAKTRFNQNQWECGPWRPSHLRLGQDLQRVWDIGTEYNLWWDGSNLSWTGELKFSGVGKHRNGLSTGNFNVSMPAVGTQIPIMGLLDGFTTVTASGIPLSQYQALYLAIEPGSIDDERNNRFFIVDDYGDDYQLPEWCVMIASRPRGCDHIRLGNGQTIYSWINLTLRTPFTNRGNGYPPVRYRKAGASKVEFDGQWFLNSAANGSVLGNLPSGYRPKQYISSIAIEGPMIGLSQTPILELNLNGDLKIWGIPVTNTTCSAGGGIFVLQ